MTNPELPHVKQIKETLHVVDPLRDATVIGSAGLALHLARCKWPEAAARVSDVDLMADPGRIYFMRSRLEKDPYIQRVNFNQWLDEYNVPVGEAELDVLPREQFGLLPVNVVSGIQYLTYRMSWYEAFKGRVEVEGEFTCRLRYY